MKYLTMICLLITGSLVANAEAHNSKFSCTYGSATGSPQTVTFEGPRNVDLSYPQGMETVPLTINGESTPTVFNVRILPTRVGHRVFYSYRNPFFVNDIALTYEEDTVGKSTFFKGTWTVDYPPVINMNCEFANTSGPISLGYRRYVIIDGVCWDDKAGVEVALFYCKG